MGACRRRVRTADMIERRDARFWHKADIPPALTNVRYRGVKLDPGVSIKRNFKAPTLNTSDPTVMKRAIDMTDDELAAIASRATLHVVK
jgi:hypothetical protein